MREFAFALAPDGIRDTGSVYEWVDTLLDTWDALKDQIPDEAIQRARQSPTYTT